ncbi:class I SAM-dependent DNA methyltransferase, partial [Flavobacterium sp.]|uniref:class I SAM-dependent DNA methyltransferase n=1 Tax=Flavobacterium sp. TaxID=239 RepID=UPI0037C17FAE
LVGGSALAEGNDIHGKFNLVLANPPFKGALDYDEVESSLLQITKTKKTELLFLSLILRMLKLGGRAAVIVPDGVLFGSSGAHKNIRKELVENQQLQGVISLPSGVFKPYAGVSTAILLFTKTNSGGTDTVWFYDMQADGFSLDDKRNAQINEDDLEAFFAKDNKNNINSEFINKCNIPQIIEHWKYQNSKYWGKMHDSEGNLLLVNDIPQNLGFDDFIEGTVTHNYSDRTSKSFLIPKADIVANDYDLSINRYKEVVYEEVVYEKPNTLIQDIKALQADNAKKLLDLEKMLEK